MYFIIYRCFLRILFLDEKKTVSRLIDVVLIDNNNDIVVDYFGSRKFLISYKSITNWDVIIDCNYTNSFHNRIISQAQKSGVPSVLIHDGIFEWKNTFENGFKYNLYSNIPHSLFLYFGTDSQHRYLSCLTGTICMPYVPNYLIKESTSIMNNGNFDFLITTANRSYFDDDEFNSLVLLLQSVIDYLETSEYSYALRIFDIKLFDRLQVYSAVNVIDCSFDLALNYIAKGVVTTKSTLQIEAMQYDIPVCELLYRDSPIFNTSGWVLYQGANYDKSFTSMANPSKERIFHQRAIVSDYLNLELSKDLSDDNATFNSVNVNKWKMKVLIKELLYKLNIKS